MSVSIYAKIARIQDKLFVPKGQYNGHGKYNYRSCEDILVAVKPLLKEEGLLLMLKDEILEISGRYYVEAHATLIDVETGATYVVRGYAREAETQSGMSAGQLTGATSSYARKYALNGLFAIDNTKDLDDEDTQRKMGQIPGGSEAQPQRVEQPAQQMSAEEKAFKEALEACTTTAELTAFMNQNKNNPFYSKYRSVAGNAFKVFEAQEKIANKKK